MHRIGFLVNPYAGMGGAVGLKGTDGLLQEAKKRGAVPLAPARAVAALRPLRDPDVHFLTCSGAMGEDEMKEAGITTYSVEYAAPEMTGADDTRNACRIFLGYAVDAIVFCGGDGTARDVYDIVGTRVPVLGICRCQNVFRSFCDHPGRSSGDPHNIRGGRSEGRRDCRC